VNVEDDRRRRVGLRLPEVEDLALVLAVCEGRGGPFRQEASFSSGVRVSFGAAFLTSFLSLVLRVGDEPGHREQGEDGEQG